MDQQPGRGKGWALPAAGWVAERACCTGGVEIERRIWGVAETDFRVATQDDVTQDRAKSLCRSEPG